MASNPGPSTSRNVWRDAEVVTMLEIFREERICDLFDGKRYKNMEIYKLVEKKMREKGVESKTADQIKNKWKALKTLYNNCVKNNSKSGAERKECEYFNLLEEIIGSRPSSSLEGVDVEVIVDEDITDQELSNLVSQSDIEQEASDTAETPKGEKRITKTYKSVVKQNDSEEFYRQQRALMEEFFQKQQEAEQRAAEARSNDLKNILQTFTQTIQTLVTSPVPSFAVGGMPYAYLPTYNKRKPSTHSVTSDSDEDELHLDERSKKTKK